LPHEFWVTASGPRRSVPVRPHGSRAAYRKKGDERKSVPSLAFSSLENPVERTCKTGPRREGSLFENLINGNEYYSNKY